MADASPRVSAPIVIFAFTRHDYLRRLCESLKAQRGVEIPEDRIHLVQDGARSRRSGNVYGDPALIEASIATFREIFPGGHVHASPDNLGIAMNLLRGEKLVFETLNEEVGYFFEEDLELGPGYIAVLEQLRRQFGGDPRLGYFAAYGNHRDAAANPLAPRIIPLEHHWGFALTRRCWRAMQPWLKPFHDIYARVDYKARPHLGIVELYEAKAVSSMASSQDVAKTMACADLGYARINTDVCYARYIGERGESFRPESFVRNGFEGARYVAEPPGAPFPAPADLLASIIELRRGEGVAHRLKRYEAELAEMRSRMFNPDRLVTREEVDQLWRLLLDRLPDKADYYETTVGKRTVRHLRRSLVTSNEGMGKGLYFPDRPASLPKD